jgi:hypothetical protein
MRKATRKSLASPDLNDAWSAFFNGIAICDPNELKKEGWMTNAEIAEQSGLRNNAGRQLADIAVRNGILEKRVAKICVSGKRKDINFYRPILPQAATS